MSYKVAFRSALESWNSDSNRLLFPYSTNPTAVPLCTVPQGVVDKVIGKYVGEICMLDSGDVIRIDQAELETVLPAPGNPVLVVNGAYRGTRGKLLCINSKTFQAEVELREGSSQGQHIWLEYEDVCKLVTK
jgi:hypothetical protein